jgi:putative ABC transport system substrate-binding protein
MRRLVTPSLGSKWSGLLKEVEPAVERIGFLFNPNTAPYAGLFLREAKTAALSLGLKLTSSPVHDDLEIERTITARGTIPGSGLIVLSEPFTNTHSSLIIDEVARHRLPTIYPYRLQAAAGGLLSYGLDLADSFRAAAAYIDRILKDEKPANFPVQNPAKFYWVVGLRTAKALGLSRGHCSLTADELIE